MKTPLGATYLVVLGLLLARPAMALFQATPEATEPSGESIQIRLGELVENIECLNDPTQTYTLYLPHRYSADRSWPVLFIFDPRGRSVTAAEIFRAAAERYGWILMSSDNTRSDGPWEPNFKAVSAMGPDVARYAYDPKRIYAAGFSGGAMLAWIWGQQTRELAGVISSGGRPVKPPASETDVPFAHFGAAGDEEFNYVPTRELDETAARLGSPHRFEAFPGPHAWMPAELALEAVEWMEIQAMSSGTRKTDDALVAELFEKDVGKAQDLKEAGALLEAHRRFDAIARTFAGLSEVEQVSATAAALAGSSEVQEALAAETSARKYEKTQLLRMGRGLGRFRSPEPFAQDGARQDGARQDGAREDGASDRNDRSRIMGVGELSLELGVPGLLKTSAGTTARSFAARRVLNSMSAQLGFYLPRDFFQEQDYGRAAVVLELATRIAPPRAFVLYNLAAARAKLGKRKAAVAALSEAVDAGFANVEWMEQDEDLKSLRKLSSYKDLVARLTQTAEDR